MTNELMYTPFKRMDGSTAKLSDYRGNVILVVNVASQCALAKQYSALEELYENKHSDGFVIVAFPANDFRNREPGTDEEIITFCTDTYGVKFPMLSKIAVTGENKHPLYHKLTASGVETVGEGPMRARLKDLGIETTGGNEILWNFEKFLISRDGVVVARFAPDVTPDDPRLVSVVERELSNAL